MEIVVEDEVIRYKKLFALEVLRNPNNVLKVAQMFYPDDIPTCLEISTAWIIDPVVIEETKRILDEEPDLFLPSKGEMCIDIYSLIKDDVTTIDQKEKLFRLYSDIRGFISKPSVEVKVGETNITQTKIMLIQKESPEQWPKSAITQQRALTDASKLD